VALTLALTILASSVALANPTARSGGTEGGSVPAPGALPSYAVGLRAVRLVDRSRMIRLKGGHRIPRTLVTYVRYPAVGTPGQTDDPGAPPAPGGPFGLVVFGHGFAVTPAIYSALLQSWTRAGFVVAAPVFPLGSAGAPGGPDEADVLNQPADMSFVISSLLAESAAGVAGDPLAGLIDPARIAVAGHSDGAETALAVAYSRRWHDPRVRASIVMSGAMMSGIGGYAYPAASAPLLAIQGTADVFNEPKYTYAYFRLARRPKFLLRLLHAEHLPPYTRQQPQLSLVEQVSTEFLRTYLPGPGSAPQSLLSALGVVPAFASLTAEP
jgi:dienelactone hydrolase